MKKILYTKDTIEKDVRRILGKKRMSQIREQNGGWIACERSNGDIEFHLTSESYDKLRNYMILHKNSRLYKSWTKDKDGYNLRFEVC